ncbi:MAG: hypothetical protein AB1648_01075 [Pseudomonadota bacterium]|jgi:nitrate/TMAO reductase-like tetraheme cytochrome c subunit
MKNNTLHLALGLCAVWFAVLYPVVTGAYTVSTVTGNLLLTPKHGGDGTAWGRTNCASCHFLQNIHEKAPNIRNWVLYKGTATCTGCHGTNGTNAPRRCIICHNSTDLAASPRQGGAHKHDFSVKKVRALGDGDCLTCHVKPDMDGQFELDVDLTAIRDASGGFSPYTGHTDFCLRCHNRDHQPPGVRIRPRPGYGLNDPLVAIEDNYTLIDRHGWVHGGGGPYAGLRGNRFRYGDEVACTACHVMHGTRNPKLILDDTRKGSNRLQKTLPRPYKARVRNGNYAEFCVLCHRMEDPFVEEGAYDAGNGLSGVHDVTSDCSECHTHGEPVLGGL